ncbi:MAG: ATPase [Alphaproteobacteria bacterium]|nr:ATPase [Alphaproteobacteria bacterium]
MLYKSADIWASESNKRAMLFGMSGLGKTHVSNILRESGKWFHYSVDYRIGTRYMGEHIVDNFKTEAMRNPFLAELLRSDSLYIASNITFDNLSPLSTYMGKPGDPKLGGIPFGEYQRRQELHRTAEISALLDAPRFSSRAQILYGYDHFICDSGGSICEVVNPDDPADPVLTALSENMLLIGIQGSCDHTEKLVERFAASPKPMYFDPAFLMSIWTAFCSENNVSEDDVDPDEFMRFAYRKCLDHRMPIYRSMAKNWGVSVRAEDVEQIKSSDDFEGLVAQAIKENRQA